MSKPAFEVAIALVHKDDSWLVAKRRHDTHLPGLWEFPGGKIERGESVTDAAVRELHEECGVDAIAERALDPLPVEYEDRHVNLTPVVCRWLRGDARSLGNDGCRWVTIEQMRELEMPAINARIIDELEEMRE